MIQFGRNMVVFGDKYHSITLIIQRIASLFGACYSYFVTISALCHEEGMVNGHR